MEKERLIEFLETKPLYTKIKVEPDNLKIITDIPNVNINVYCKICKSQRTFILEQKSIFYHTGNYFVDAMDRTISSI